MKSESQIKSEYLVVEKYALIVSFLFFVLAVPKLVLGFTDLDVFLGFTKMSALYLFTVGGVIYAVFFYKFWNCPSCSQYPGGRWIIKNSCKKCHVKLK